VYEAKRAEVTKYLEVGHGPAPAADSPKTIGPAKALAHDPSLSSQAQRPTSPRAARRRPKQPLRRLAADLYRWSEFARREPLWAARGEGSGARPPGRPRKLNPEVVGRFLMAIRAGNYRETAARLAGIGPATMYRWLHDPRPEFAAFRMALDMCEAEVEAEVIGNLFRLSRTSTRAAAFILSRRWPERWATPGRPAIKARQAQPSLRDIVVSDAERFPEIAAHLYVQNEEVRAFIERVMRVG
jgi:hypothetical protein